MALAFERLRVFVFAQNIFVELHLRSTKVLEKRLDTFLAPHYFVGQIIDIDIDADRTHDPEFLARNRDGRALEFPRTDI